MTVCVSQDKISKKVGIPLMVFFAVGSVCIWFFPIREYYRINEIICYVINGIASFGGLIGFLMTLWWTLWDDKTEALNKGGINKKGKQDG